MSLRAVLLCALVLSSFTAIVAREARAQSAEPMTATILRRTAVRIAPEAGASTIAFVNPGTFEVTEARLQSGFVRLLLRQIDPRRPAGGFGFIAEKDIAIDSAMTTHPVAAPSTASLPAPAPAAAPARTEPARSAPAPAARPAAPSVAQPPAVVPAPRKDTATVTRAVASTDSVPPLARFLVGVWTCKGGTPAGRTLDSDVRFTASLGDRWLQSAHVDVAPGRYSSLAMWPLAPADSEPLTTVVYDNFGGARRFLLDGWTADSVVLVRDRTERGARAEQFTYRRVSPDSYWYAWHVRRDASGPAVLGDSATCTRSARARQ